MKVLLLLCALTIFCSAGCEENDRTSTQTSTAVGEGSRQTANAFGNSVSALGWDIGLVLDPTKSGDEYAVSTQLPQKPEILKLIYVIHNHGGGYLHLAWIDSYTGDNKPFKVRIPAPYPARPVLRPANEGEVQYYKVKNQYKDDLNNFLVDSIRAEEEFQTLLTNASEILDQYYDAMRNSDFGHSDVNRCINNMVEQVGASKAPQCLHHVIIAISDLKDNVAPAHEVKPCAASQIAFYQVVPNREALRIDLNPIWLPEFDADAFQTIFSSQSSI